MTFVSLTFPTQTNSFSLSVFIMNSHMNLNKFEYLFTVGTQCVYVCVFANVYVCVLTLLVICGSFKCIRCTACLWHKIDKQFL